MLRLDYAARELLGAGGARARLFPQEFAMLVTLVRRRATQAGAVCRLEEFGRPLWGPESCWPQDWRNVALNRMCGVRARLRAVHAPADAIETLLGRGYRLIVEIEIVNEETAPAGGRNSVSTERSTS